MTASRRPLIIPVENQVRELESKLLLACVAAERGFPVIVGSGSAIHLRASALPRGIYFGRSMAASAVRMLGIMRALGHEIVVQLQDGLVHCPAQHYYETRIAPEAMHTAAQLFAWGEESARLLAGCPGHDDAPIHATGNPRTDLLRQELRPYFADSTRQVRDRFGSFLLVNTNFASVNHFSPKLSKTKSEFEKGTSPETAEFLAGRLDYRNQMLEHFRTVVSSLAEAFPREAIVVRPHPAEDPTPWQEVAARHSNVHAVLEDNVVPWLAASRATIQNGCTTGLEAFLLRVPTVSYEPIASERFAPQLPNALSHRTSGFDDLAATLERVLDGRLGACDSPEQWALIGTHVAATDGPLAADRIVDVLVAADEAPRSPERPPLGEHLEGWLRANFRAASKFAASRLPGSRKNAAYQKHRFPALGGEAVRDRIGRLGAALGRFDGLRVEEIHDDVCRISI